MIPKKVVIFGETYAIEKKKGLSDSTGNLDGLHCAYEKKIWINPDGHDVFGTFLHECLHGVLYRIGAHGNISEEMEEVIVSGIEKFLVEGFDIQCKKSNAKSKTSGSGRKSRTRK